MAGLRSPVARAAATGGPQHGVVARRQLLRAGLSSSAIEHLLATRRLLLLYRGVYAVGHRPVGPRSREMAVALLANGPLARPSAAGLWAITRPWHGPVHAIGAKPRAGPGFVIHRTRNLPRKDVTTHWGIPVTTPLRTLLDLSRTLSLDALDAALAEALVRKLVTLDDLRPRATGNLKRLLATAAPTRSELERDFRRMLRRHDLPQPISNGIVEGYEVDLHWPDLKLVAELDGYAYHGHQRAFESDRERDIVLAAAGWQTVRLTDRQLTEQRQQTADRFGALLTPPAAVDVRYSRDARSSACSSGSTSVTAATGSSP
jgi:very-short-patch-repair endonuclease